MTVSLVLCYLCKNFRRVMVERSEGRSTHWSDRTLTDLEICVSVGVTPSESQGVTSVEIHLYCYHGGENFPTPFLVTLLRTSRESSNRPCTFRSYLPTDNNEVQLITFN